MVYKHTVRLEKREGTLGVRVNGQHLQAIAVREDASYEAVQMVLKTPESRWGGVQRTSLLGLRFGPLAATASR